MLSTVARAGLVAPFWVSLPCFTQLWSHLYRPTAHPLQPAPQKYKGIWVCLAILTRALGGNYVNFGVFELYGDPALKVGVFFVCRVCLGWWWWWWVVVLRGEGRQDVKVGVIELYGDPGSM